MNEEDKTYRELMIGHLLRRQDELEELIKDPNNIGVFSEMSREMVENSGKIIEFLRKEQGL